MRIFLTGGTGLIGRALCRALQADGHSLTVLSRNPKSVHKILGPDVLAISELGEWWHNQQFDAVINLAGEPIVDRKWIERQKRRIWESRVDLTKNLVQRIANVEHKPSVLLSGSAVGYYGFRGEEVLNEDSGCGDDFGAKLCVAWERAAAEAEKYGVRVCLLRTGLVLSREGGMLTYMLPSFRLGLGARLSSGRQWMSWVHIDDYVSMVQTLLVNSRARGAYNLVAPNPVVNAEFVATLGKVLRRPVVFAVPGWLLRMTMGERACLLLEGQRALPDKIEKLGYRFAYPYLDQALRRLLG